MVATVFVLVSWSNPDAPHLRADQGDISVWLSKPAEVRAHAKDGNITLHLPSIDDAKITLIAGDRYSVESPDIEHAGSGPWQQTLGAGDWTIALDAPHGVVRILVDPPEDPKGAP